MSRSRSYRCSMTLFCVVCGVGWGCQPLGQEGDEECSRDAQGFEDASCEALQQVGVISPLDGSTNFQGELIIHRGAAPIDVTRQVKVRLPSEQFVVMRYAPSTSVSNQYIGTPVEAYAPNDYTVTLEDSAASSFNSISFRTWPSDPPALLSADVSVVEQADGDAGELRQLALVFSEPMNISPSNITLYVNGAQRAPHAINQGQRTPHNPVLSVQYTSPAAEDDIILDVEDTLTSSTNGLAFGARSLEGVTVSSQGETSRQLRLTYKNGDQSDPQGTTDPPSPVE